MEEKKEKCVPKDLANWEPFVKHLKEEWNKPIEDSRENHLIRERIWQSIYNRTFRNRKYKSLRLRLRIAASVAASILLCIFAGQLILEKSTNSEPISQKLVVASKSQTFVLPDGSKVWMEKGSRIRFSDNFIEDRKVWLDGNSTFEVVKKEGRFFKVQLTDSYVEVKGTCFSIKQDRPEANIITLYSGRIDFVSGIDQNRIELHPSQSIVYNTVNASTQVKSISPDIIWENGNYKLSQVDLQELLEFIDWKYSTTIELKNLPEGDLKVTGNIYFDESIKSVLDKICFSLDLKYKQVDGKNIVYK